MLRQAEVVNQRKSTKRKCIIVKCTHQKRNDYVISHSAEEKLICVICIHVFYFKKKKCMAIGCISFAHWEVALKNLMLAKGRVKKIYQSKSRVKADNDNYQKWNKAKYINAKNETFEKYKE